MATKRELIRTANTILWKEDDKGERVFPIDPKQPDICQAKKEARRIALEKVTMPDGTEVTPLAGLTNAICAQCPKTRQCDQTITLAKAYEIINGTCEATNQASI
ncbi:MAG: hypothetical protein WCV93_02010 [Candidatus Shapirobacteria bacterium]|jgi:hypothetical protein